MAKYTLALFAAVALAIAGAHAADPEVEEGVTVGTDANFADLIKNNDYVLVEFYAPWCGHCKSLAPEYAEAAQKLKEAGNEALLVKVDATEHEKSAEEHQVQGFPTLKWFKRGKASDYSGGRTASEIIAWIKKKTGPAAVPVTTVEAAQESIDTERVVVFGFFESETSTEAKEFVKAAEKSDLSFAITTEKAVADANDATAPQVIVFTNFDEKRYEFSGEITEEAISEFATASSVPLVIEFSEETAPIIFGGEIKSHYLFFVDSTSDGVADLKTEFSTAAKQLKGKVMMITLDISVESHERILEFFGISKEDCPTYRIINVEAEMAKYAPESNDLTAEAMAKFGQDYVDGNLKKNMNIEPLPADWDTKPVKVLTGENFHEVTTSEKHVLVEFYAPWCGHCKQLAPIYDQLGEIFEKHENIMIAKMDATANEIDGLQIEGFPTLKFYSKDGDVADFDGGRDLKDMAEFVAKKAGVEMPELPEGSEAGAEGTGEEPHDEL
jgi:protein disulfide-isomerase A1